MLSSRSGRLPHCPLLAPHVTSRRKSSRPCRRQREGRRAATAARTLKMRSTVKPNTVIALQVRKPQASEISEYCFWMHQVRYQKDASLFFSVFSKFWLRLVEMILQGGITDSQKVALGWCMCYALVIEEIQPNSRRKVGSSSHDFRWFWYVPPCAEFLKLFYKG